MIFVLLVFASGVLTAQIKGLDAAGPDPELADKLSLFGQFVGDWECDVVQLMPNGSKVNGKCDWHFGWTLEGKAVQDVFHVRYDAKNPGEPTGGLGTTLRWLDPKTGVWHAIWISARDNIVHTFIARKEGDEIVLEGQDSPDHPFRWIFSEVKPQSFHWRSMASLDGGKSWIVGQAMSVRRVATPPGERTARDREAIRTLEQEWLDHESDRPALERILADDFVHPVAAGVFLKKKDHIDWSVQHPRPADRRARFETLEVRLFGGTAIATGIVEDTNSGGGDSRRTIFTDVFAFRNGLWQAVSAEETAIFAKH